tara:strand:- start:1038 stop:1274 length:237 start_codon:yes stop_codon:yes gene_type:complete
MLPFFLGIYMKFEDYYKEFCQVFGHPLWMMPMMLIGMFFMIEVMHTRYHADADADAHGYCGQKEFVKELQRFYENNAY